jgi:hypothetical protein
MSTPSTRKGTALSDMVQEAQQLNQQASPQVSDDTIQKAFSAKVRALLDPDRYVGEIFRLTYDEATVIVHDKHRRLVGGVANSAFLLATRLKSEEKQTLPLTDEDACFVLLRVMDAAPLPDDVEAVKTRADAAAEVSGSKDEHWDQGTGMDAYTSHQLGYAGLQCKVLGTFYFVRNKDEVVLEMGTDLDNFYPNRGLKAFKPVGAHLAAIVNYYKPGMITDPMLKPYADLEVKVGAVRYSSTDRRAIRNEPLAEFKIRPADLIAQKSAFFGMTRTGKSNTIKVIVRAIHKLRHLEDKKITPLKVGQIIFDPNGEYGNANDVQASLKKLGDDNSMFIYSLGAGDDKGTHRSLRFDFHDNTNRDLGKGLLDEVLAQSASAKNQYATGFQGVVFGPKPELGEAKQKNDAKGEEEEETTGWGEILGWARKVEIYHTILHRAGFTTKRIGPKLDRLFPKELREALTKGGLASAATTLAGTPTWDEFSTALGDLYKFAAGDSPVWKEFEETYRKDHKGKAWMTPDVRNLLYFHNFPNAINQLRRAAVFHKPGKKGDYADEIYQHLEKGLLVIVDLSLGNKQAGVTISERIASTIFQRNGAKFADGTGDLPNIIIYAEEAHRLLPPGNEQDNKNIWAAIAKEGAKFRIGLAYSTQEPSSIQKSIIKATYNFFVSHLNNEEEMREIGKYYDLADFKRSILRNQDRGFVRIKTLSSPFTVPVQIERFEE